MSIQITAIYASLLAIFYIVLSFRVARRRMRFQVGLGTGQNIELERAIRIHGNFGEYIPLALLLLASSRAAVARPGQCMWRARGCCSAAWSIRLA